MTDLSAALRKQLGEMTTLALPPVLKHEHSDDGTRKWLLDVGANQAVETVYIPEPEPRHACASRRRRVRARLRVLRDGVPGLQPQS